MEIPAGVQLDGTSLLPLLLQPASSTTARINSYDSRTVTKNNKDSRREKVKDVETYLNNVQNASSYNKFPVYWKKAIQWMGFKMHESNKGV